jgi:hypothetical protein
MGKKCFSKIASNKQKKTLKNLKIPFFKSNLYNGNVLIKFW